MPRVREAGDSMLIVEFGDEIDLDVNARVLAAAARLRAAAWPGVRDVVPTCRSVAVAFDPLRTDVAGITEAIRRTADGPVAAEAGRTVDIPVEYGGEAGPDLEEVAARSGLSPEEVVARHASRPYRVLMLGFLPGFAYLGPVDSSIVAPRRPSPRRRVPPGSVAIAGGQTGIYPQASPGGWQIVGRTTLHPFAASRTPPALLSPGDAVRFVPAAPGSLGSFDAAWAEVPSTGPARPEPAGVRPPTSPLVGRGVTVLTAGLMTTVQDGGRWGHQHEGVPVSGAMDLEALRRANHAMGHPPTAAALEATLSGLELRVDHAGAVAIAGADLGATLDGRPVPLHTPTSCGAGAVLRLTGRARGTRAYVAFDGAIDVAPCLGSRATDMTSGLGGLGGRRLRAGDRLTLGASAAGSSRREPAATRPVPAGGARVRVLPGPHDEWFSAGAIALLQRTRFELTPESNRMGYRLHGPQPVPRDPREMLSDATCAGGLQVPPSGQPILLMADRQVTGGYPIIATVITADLPVAGQLAPGDWIEFELCTRGEAIRALAEQERAYGAAE